MPSANLRYNAAFPLDSLPIRHLFASHNAMPVTSPTYQPANFAYEPFRPALQERFLARFYQAARSLVHQTEPQREATIRTEVEWAITSQGNPRQQALYKAVWLLLRDLLHVGWTPRWNEVTATFEVAPPPPYAKPHSQAAIQAHKQGRRDVMAPERHTRLVQATDFIRRMEAPSRGMPITALLADGVQLAADLQAVQSLQDVEARVEALSRCIHPYLQLVEEHARCQYTGLLLGDIWRYFRLTWASPVYNTPGRSLFYLVRDAARPNHPVMGIASLENAPIFIGDRDTYLGWTPDAFIEALVPTQSEAPTAGPDLGLVCAAFKHLLSNIQRAINDINAEGLCTPEERIQPTLELVQRLSAQAAQFAHERQDALREWKLYSKQPDKSGEADLQQSAYGNISEQAYELLFLKKRAGELARLLGARIAIEQLLARADFAQEWQGWAESERGRGAIRNGLVAIKNQHVGTSILELNICGAIPPYNHLLAGKLTTLLMCSPQVAADYKRRYGQARSEIASQLKGETVVRPAELVYIGTTALYTAGSSQYNRLRLPAGLLRPDAAETPIVCIGETLGYGTSHISDATTTALKDAVSDAFLQVNHILGEGVSPKMRIIRQGLDAIFRDGQRVLSDRVAQHQMRRLVYGVFLAENGQEYLQGKAEQPRYIWDADMPPTEGTERIAAFWRRRWLEARLHFAPTLARVAQFRPAELLLSRELVQQEDYDWAYRLIKLKPETATLADAPPFADTHTTADEQQRRLVRDLYGGATGFADDVPLENLKRLHAVTDLDKVIREQIKAKRSVVLTGNPGDGKTHLLRILEDDIAALGAVVERDASAVLNEQIVANWRAALDAGRPYFIAINESVLFKLAASYPAFELLQAARRQVTGALTYGAAPSLPVSEVVVLDLSHRNTLDATLVNAVIDKLTEQTMLPRCPQCPAAGCDLVRNQALLREPLVRKRLQAIFDSITRRGIHVTMRDLQAFCAYLLFADRDCTGLLQQSDEAALALPQLPYTGKGPLFEAVRKVFDPAKVCHPIYDDQLVNNTLPTAGWLTNNANTGSLDATAIKPFAQRKRAFYFYHQRGDALLALVGDDEQAFATFLAEPDPRKALRQMLQKLNAFFGRPSDPERLPVWQSHRYDQSAQRILYAVQSRQRQEFELLQPQLASPMAEAFRLADDHRVLRLKRNPQASLRIDYRLFRLLHQAERGLPALLLQPEATRRIWQFLEQLTDRDLALDDEVTAQILDPVTGAYLEVRVDTQTKTYISITDKEDRRV